jgi:DNA-binding CsgD family transcriptional regulator
MHMPHSEALAGQVLAKGKDPVGLPAFRPGETESEFGWAAQALRMEAGGSFAIILGHERDGSELRLMACNGVPLAQAFAFATLLTGLEDEGDEGAGREIISETWLELPDNGVPQLLYLRRGSDGLGVAVGFAAAPQDAGMRRAATAGRMLLSCIGRFASLQRDLRVERHRTAGLREALDHVNVGIGVLSVSKQLEFANLALREIMQQHDGLRSSGDSITATSLKDAVRLQVSIDHVMAHDGFDPDRDAEEHALMLALPRPAGKPPLMTAILPPGAVADGRNDTAALLFVVRPDGDLSAALTPICRLHGLSPVETRLACHLAMGKPLCEAALTMRIKPQTARAYLRQIFQKTSTNRQADLIRLILRNLLPFFDRTKVDAIV